jgi:hypothetical protein
MDDLDHCPICLEEVDAADAVVKPCCRGRLHARCESEWAVHARRDDCCLCRADPNEDVRVGGETVVSKVEDEREARDCPVVLVILIIAAGGFFIACLVLLR